MTSIKFDEALQPLIVRSVALDKNGPSMLLSTQLDEQVSLRRDIDKLFSESARDEMMGTRVNILA